MAGDTVGGLMKLTCPLMRECKQGSGHRPVTEEVWTSGSTEYFRRGCTHIELSSDLFIYVIMSMETQQHMTVPFHDVRREIRQAGGGGGHRRIVKRAVCPATQSICFLDKVLFVLLAQYK